MNNILRGVIVIAIMMLIAAVAIVIWAMLGYLVGLLIHSFIPGFNPVWCVCIFLLVVFLKGKNEK